MAPRELSRRTVLQGGAALAALAVFRAHAPDTVDARQSDKRITPSAVPSELSSLAFPTRPGEEVIPWLDQPAENPVPHIAGHLLRWEELDSWIIPNEEFFTIQHFNLPEIAPEAWRLEMTGLVEQPQTVTLDNLLARPRHEVTFTMECSGNTGLPFLIGAVGNATWAGTPLGPILQGAGPLPEGIEVVFWGADLGPGEVNVTTVVEYFARSMSLEDAMDPRTSCATR